MTTRYAPITKESELIKYYIKVKKKKMRSAKDYIWCVSYEPSEQHMEQKHQELSVRLHNRKINLWDSEAHHPCRIPPTGHH